MELIGVFGLIEFEIGFVVVVGFMIIVKWMEKGWVFNGEKKWIGNVIFVDVMIIWVKDEVD